MQLLKKAANSVLIVAACTSVAGLAIGYGLAHIQAFDDRAALLASVYPLLATNKNMPLIHPLVAFETPESTDLKEYVSLKAHIEEVVAELRTSEPVETVSVYYRNLQTGRWIAIDKNENYYPASLLKVPVMIAYYSQRRSDPTLFDDYITYKHVTGESEFETKSELEVGKAYSVSELIRRMIVDSDNGATYTLISYIDDDVLSAVYTDLGIDDPGEDTGGYKISTKTYALFFRVLYNATYLSQRASEDALELLANSTYKNGLVAGVPKDITVAHKFGEHVLNKGDAVKGIELHDCGVVYVPDHPYLLCVMTRAASLPVAESAISLVSKTVYEAVKNEVAQ